MRFFLSKAINLTCFYAVCTFITSDFGNCSCIYDGLSIRYGEGKEEEEEGGGRIL